MNEIKRSENELSNDLNVITAEINSYKQVAGQAIFEIGRRLKYVKEKDLAKGEFKQWAKENCDFEPNTAYRFIKAFEQFGKVPHVALPTNKIFEMLSLPQEIDREEFIKKDHTVLTTGEKKTVNEMTINELREVKAELKKICDQNKLLEKENYEIKESEKQARESERQAKEKEKRAIEEKKFVDRQLENEKKKAQKVIEKTVEVYVKDEESIKRLKKEIEKMQSKFTHLEKEKDLLESKMSLYKKDASEYKKLKKDLENLQEQKNEVLQHIDNAGKLGTLIAEVEYFLMHKLAPIAYSDAITNIGNGEPVKKTLCEKIQKVENWCREMQSIVGGKKIIQAEVIEYES